MGWKATKTISREKAIELIVKKALSASDDELSNALEGLGYGDNPSLPYYGYNFTVEDGSEEEIDEDEDATT